MGIVTSEGFGYLLDPGLRKIFMDEYAMPEGQVDALFGVETSGKATEYDLSVGGIGDLEEFTGTIPYDDFKQQYRVSYTHKEWVKGMKVERKLVDDDQYSIINKRPAQLALVAKRTKEKHGSTVFNNAFNTTIFAGGDGYALCHSAHTRVGTATTVGNAGSTALSQTAIEATRLLMRQFTDETDNLITARADTLLVPPALEETAYEIVNTAQKLNTAENNVNFSQNKYKIIVWDYLTDSNNWFVLDSRMAKMYLKWFNRIGIEFNKDKDFDTYVSKWSCYTRYSYGFSDWTWIYGHNVA
jgi:phage major head subunit gpT-like protein